MTKEEVRQLLELSNIWERDSNPVIYFAYIGNKYCEICLNEDNISYSIQFDEDTREHIAHIPYRNLVKYILPDRLETSGLSGIFLRIDL